MKLTHPVTSQQRRNLPNVYHTTANYCEVLLPSNIAFAHTYGTYLSVPLLNIQTNLSDPRTQSCPLMLWYTQWLAHWEGWSQCTPAVPHSDIDRNL
jgi:hypothetical protein